MISKVKFYVQNLHIHMNVYHKQFQKYTRMYDCMKFVLRKTVRHLLKCVRYFSIGIFCFRQFSKIICQMMHSFKPLMMNDSLANYMVVKKLEQKGQFPVISWFNHLSNILSWFWCIFELYQLYYIVPFLYSITTSSKNV